MTKWLGDHYHCGMAEQNLSDVSIKTLLERLRSAEWQVPQFQREFVWSTADVIELINSILEARPIGMATLWDFGAVDYEILMERIWIPDGAGRRTFDPPAEPPRHISAILDGRQRCTAIAMAFGGLRAQSGKFRFAGRYYLNVVTVDDSERVRFLRASEIERRHLTTDAKCISEGLFPLDSSAAGEGLLQQWMRYLQALKEPQNYPNGVLPDEEELRRRDGVLKKAFEGLAGTKLPVFTVPSSYGLSEICDIFETLNTTGTKVSNVDLIHSWLYADTRNDTEPIILRDWIGDLGQMDGAKGWAVREERPELIAQIATACYIATERKEKPRRVPGGRSGDVVTLKSSDLLATPTSHWRLITSNADLLAEFIGDFQKVVADGHFPYNACPYPISAAVYVALRWHHHFDKPQEWGRAELDSLYRAFFWRNALNTRYDQGFLTTISSDLRDIKDRLVERCRYRTIREWALEAEEWLNNLIPLTQMPCERIAEALGEPRQPGALMKALSLPLVAHATFDLIDQKIEIDFPATYVELHHIYPRAWCRSNKVGKLAEAIDRISGQEMYVDSVVNLIPLSRRSNNQWKAKAPGQVLRESGLNFGGVREIALPLYIDEEAFHLLTLEPIKSVVKFWEHRAELISKDIFRRTQIEV